MDKLKVYEKLKTIITSPVCELEYEDNFQLLIAVILSAQCTDKRVNIVTKELFRKYPTAAKLSMADIEDVKKIIKPCGFFNNKSVSIISASKDLVEKFDGVVPSSYDDLMSLRGVGRKTANVVRAVGFKIPSIAVDTHVFRVSNRLNLAKSSNPNECEIKLMKSFDKKHWIDLHHVLLLYGRYVCTSQKPKCETCIVKDECKFYKERRK